MTTAEKLRTQRGPLTQEQAAEVIGCPVATYRDWEQGRREPPKWIRRIAIGKLANATKSEPVEYWDGSKPQKKRKASRGKSNVRDDLPLTRKKGKV